MPKHASRRATGGFACRPGKPPIALIFPAIAGTALLLAGCATDNRPAAQAGSAAPPPAGTAPPPSPPPDSAVTLSWTPATSNEDGSALTNLAGYRVYYGQVPHDWSSRLEIARESTSAEIGGLANGTWFFAVTSFNTAGHESDFSAVASTMIGT